MKTADYQVLQGEWLFRWRSYLPLVFFPVLASAALQSDYLFGMYDFTWELFSFSVSVFGLFIRAYTIGHTPKSTSGRNTHRQKAKLLNTRGIYSIVRNPLYLGNFFMMLGVVMFLAVWWAIIIYVLFFALYYERIIAAEERFLESRFGYAFEEYCKKTPVIVPDFGLWQAPELPFSMRNVLKREYSGFFAIFLCFTILEVWEDFTDLGELYFDPFWATMFICALVLYLIFRTLRKKYRVLHVEAR